MPSFKKYILPLVIFIGVLFLYIHNLSRATYGGDVGDLLSAAIVGGVAHPPGYPLFTFLGFLFSRINFISPAFMIGLISTISGALGILFFYFLSFNFTKSKLISLISSLILAFSYYFWLYSEMAEVFALNNLFAICLFLLAFRYFKTGKNLFLLSLVAGLSLSNHHTIIFIFPSLFILAFSNLRHDLKKIKNIVFCVLFFILGLMPYVYVPIASSFNPPVNWDKVKDLDSFLHLILRKDYGTFNIGHVLDATIEQRFAIFKIYFFSLITQATIPVFIISILGAYCAFRKNVKIFTSILLAFILSGPVFVIYAGFPLYDSFNVGVYERFLILSFVILLMFFPFGLLLIKELFERVFSKKEYGLMLLGVFILIPLLLFKYNFPKTNLSTTTIGDDLAYDLLSPLPKNSVIFLSGDTVLFNTWYIYFGKKFRPDLEIINVNGVTENKFFYKEQEEFLKNNHKEKISSDTNIKIILEIAKKRNVFSIINAQLSKGEKLLWVPYGLSLKLFTKDNLLSREEYKTQMDKLWKELHVPFDSDKSLIIGNLTISEIPLLYSNALIRTGEYFLKEYIDKQEAFKYYEDAIRVDKNNPKAYQVIAAYYIQEGESCNLAEKNIKQAITISPYDSLSHFLLYYVYTNCFDDGQKAKQVEREYNKNFKSNFFEDLKKTINADKL